MLKELEGVLGLTASGESDVNSNETAPGQPRRKDSIESTEASQTLYDSIKSKIED